MYLWLAPSGVRRTSIQLLQPPRPGPSPGRYWRRRLVRPLVNTGDGGEATCSGSVALIAMLGLALLEAYYLPRQHSNNLIHDNEVASLWVMRASLPMLLWSWFICRTHFISRRFHLGLLIYEAPSPATSLRPFFLPLPRLQYCLLSLLSAFNSIFKVSSSTIFGGKLLN